MASSEPPTPHFPGWYPPTPGTPASDTFSTKDGSAVGASGGDEDLPSFVGQDISVDSNKPQKYNYEQGGILDEAGRKLAAGGAAGVGAGTVGALGETRDSERTPTEEKTNPVDQKVGLGLSDVQTSDPTATTTTNGETATAPTAKKDDEEPKSTLGERAGTVAAVLGGATAAVAGALGVKSFQEKELEEARAVESGDAARASGAGRDSSLLPAPANSSLATQPIDEASSTLSDPKATEPEPITTASNPSGAVPAVDEEEEKKKKESTAGPLAALGAALGAGALAGTGFQDHELQEARAHEAEEAAAEAGAPAQGTSSSLDPSTSAGTTSVPATMTTTPSTTSAEPVQPVTASAAATTVPSAEATSPSSNTAAAEQSQPTTTDEHDKSSTFVPAALGGAALAGAGAAALAHDGSEDTPKATNQPLPSTDSSAPVGSSTPAVAGASDAKTFPQAAESTMPSKISSPDEKESPSKPKEKSAFKSALAAVGIGRKDKDKKSKAGEPAAEEEKDAGVVEKKADAKTEDSSDLGKAALAGGAVAGAGAILAGQHGDELVKKDGQNAETAPPVVQQSDPAASIGQPSIIDEQKDGAAPSASSAAPTTALAASTPADTTLPDVKSADGLVGGPVQQQQPPNMDAARAAALQAHNAALAQHAPHVLPITNVASSAETNDPTAAALAAHNSALATHAPHAVGDNGANAVAGQSPAFPPPGENVQALSGAGVTNEPAHAARIDQLRAGGADSQGGYKHGKAIIHYGAPGTETDVGHRPGGLGETDSFSSDFPGGPVRRHTEDGADSNSSTQALVGTPITEAQKELLLDTADEKKRITSPLAAAAIGGAVSAAALAAAHEHEQHDAKEGGAGSTGHTARKLSRKRKSVIKKDEDAATALAQQKTEEELRRQHENEAKRDAMFATMGAGNDPTAAKPSSPKHSSIFSRSRPGSNGGSASVASLDTGATTGARDGHSPTSASPSGKRHGVLRRHHGTSESGASDTSGASGGDLKKQDHSGHNVTQPFPSSDDGGADRRHKRATSVGATSQGDGYTSDGQGNRSRKNTLKRRSHYEAIAREHEEQLRHERESSSATAATSSDADRRTANSSAADTEGDSEPGVEEGGKRKKKGSLFKRIFSKGDKEKNKEADQSPQQVQA